MNNFYQILITIIISGAFGGFVIGIILKNKYQVKLPFSGKYIELGIFGDMSIGIVASIILVFFFSSIPQIDFNATELTNKDIFTIIFISLIAGYSGIKVLKGVSKDILKSLEEQDK